MGRLRTVPVYLLTCTIAFSQTGSGGPVSPPSVVAGELVFEASQRTSLGALGTAMSVGYVCADDGSTFLQIADSPRKVDFVLHSLQGTVGDTRFDLPHVPGYATIATNWPWNFFVNDQQVAILVQVPVEQNQFEKQAGAMRLAWLVLLYDRKGTFQRAVPVPQDLDPKSVGIYGSGDLLVIAANPITKAAELYVLSTKGDIIRHFLLFDEDYNTSKEAKKQQPLAVMTPDGALTFMQLVANGSNLLLIPQSTSAPISEVNEHGIVRTVPLKLPEGVVVAGLLSHTKSVWKMRTNANIRLDSPNERTGKIDGALQSEGPLLDFSSSDGSLLRRIDRPTNVDGIIACEHNGDYTAITTDSKDGRLEIRKATEVKK
jgi:hypothetical protein